MISCTSFYKLTRKRQLGKETREKKRQTIQNKVDIWKRVDHYATAVTPECNHVTINCLITA